MINFFANLWFGIFLIFPQFIGVWGGIAVELGGTVCLLIYIYIHCYIGLNTKPPRLQAVLEDVAALVWRIGHRQPLEMLQKMDHLTVPTPDLDKR